MRPFSSDAGSAPVEFLGFGVPLFALVLVATQILGISYLNNVAMDAASEAASSLAYADGTEAKATQKAHNVVHQLAPNSEAKVTVSSVSIDGVSMAEASVQIVNPFLLLGDFPVTQTMKAVSENG